jgi:hypothetical protein
VDNFTAIRNGILDHLREGKLCPFDLGIYIFLHLRADWTTGIYTGCALTIAHQFADPSLKHHINKSLIRLRERRYVNYRKGDGRRGGYPILIHKYHVTVGELSGMRLNAWKHGELAKPEYEVWNGHGRVEEESGKSGGRVEEPILDFNKTLLDVKDENLSSKTDAGFYQAILEIWSYYTTTLSRSKLTTLTDKRKRMARARLKECFARVRDPQLENATNVLKLTIDRLKDSKWHNGQNPDGKKYLTWEILFRTSEQFEKWTNDENFCQGAA